MIFFSSIIGCGVPGRRTTILPHSHGQSYLHGIGTRDGGLKSEASSKYRRAPGKASAG
jgi:hypothetical protein